MRARAAAAAAALAAVAGVATAEGLRFEVRSQHHNDAVALAAMDDDGVEARLLPRPGRNVALIDDELRVWAPLGDWRFALLARQHASIVADAALLAAAARVAQGGANPGDFDGAGRARLRAFAGVGVAVGRDGALAAGWRWQAEAQALQLRRWRERTIEGSISRRGGLWAFDGRSDESDHKLDFPYRDAVPGRGFALLGRVGLRWEGTAAWAAASWADAGWLRWPARPRQTLVVASSTRAVDPEGFVVYRPLLQGQNAQDGTPRWSAGRLEAEAGAVLGGQRLAVRARTLQGTAVVLPALAWQGAPLAGWTPEAAWHWRERRLVVGAARDGLSLRLGADRLGSGAKSREFGFAWTLPL